MAVLTNGFRVSFFFQQLSTKVPGWTENYWNSTPDISIALTRATALRVMLQNTKGYQSWCKKGRISSVVNFRQVLPLRLPGAGPTDSNTGTHDSDYPTSKIQLKLTGGGKTTTQWMGGIEDRQIVRGGFYVPIGVNIGEMNALYAHLTSGANGWSIYGLTPQTRTPISGFNPETGLVTTAVAHGLISGDRVRISRGAGNTAINGLWTITLVSTTTFTLNFWVASTTPLTKSKVTVQKQDYGFTQITAASAGEATSHAVGRPTDLAGGKRRRKKTV